MSAALSDNQLDRFADLMHELISLQIEMNALVSSRTVLTEGEKTGLKDKDKVREWLRKAREIAEEVKPREFTVGAKVGFPPKLSVAFTW